MVNFISHHLVDGGNMLYKRIIDRGASLIMKPAVSDIVFHKLMAKCRSAITLPLIAIVFLEA